MLKRKAFEKSLCLLESFPPVAWEEGAYVMMPPFISESNDGSLLVVPTNSETERILDGIRIPLGLRKIQTDQPSYLTSRNDTINAVRIFYWFVRKSWRDRKHAVLWALAHECRKQMQTSVTVSLETLVSLTGCESKACAEVASRFESGNHRTHNGSYSTYEVDAARVYQALLRSLEETPSRAEEMVMRTLCSETGASAAELYDQLQPHDLTVGALYKMVERLKRDGYIHTIKHFRVNERGPMREFLSSSCRNCFYGFSGAESCSEDAFRQLEQILKKYYGKDIGESERTDSRNAMRSLPLNPRVLRKAIEALVLIQRMQCLLEEKQVASVLGKIGEWYGMTLPVQLENLSNISSGPN